PQNGQARVNGQHALGTLNAKTDDGSQKKPAADGARASPERSRGKENFALRTNIRQRGSRLMKEGTALG
ncbi:MAG: hypothetical protein ACT4O3_05310, partial [Elusimicrobiota bacterium]